MSNIENLEETIKNLQKLLLEKNIENASKDLQIAAKDKEIAEKNVKINEQDQQIQTIVNLDSAAMVSRLIELDGRNRQKIKQLEDELEDDIVNRQKIVELEEDIDDLRFEAIAADKLLTNTMEKVKRSKEERSKKDIVTINNLYQENIKKDQEIAKKFEISRQIVQAQEQEIIEFIY